MEKIDSKKMYLLLPLLFFIGSARALETESSVTISDLCTIDEDPDSSIPFVECLCSNRENFTYTSLFVYNINRITIKGCGSVHLGFDSLSNLHLKQLSFVDLQSLTLQTFSLFWTEEIENLKIEDVGDLIIQQHAFSGLRNVDMVTLKNVTVQRLPKEAFSSIANVRLMIIEGSAFYYIEQLAFVVQNVTILKVIDSEFHALEDSSFFILESDVVQFKDCTFETTDNQTFVISRVDSISFYNCSFEDLAPNSVQTHNVNTISFTNSVIEVLHPDAFTGLKVVEKIEFKWNTIRIMYNNSLEPILAPELKYVEVDFCCNSFTCDCNIFWLWSLKNREILENSTCIEDLSTTVSLYVPILDSENICMTLELKSSQYEYHGNTSYKVMIHHMGKASTASPFQLMLFIIIGSWFSYYFPK
ncbi:hypothetical protein JTE90_010382 [Oedothorax gibbosus]|uniref:Right handed beta helix domain-containing protein n=1 Tax=Oedothorax gibbosus TaxID=931172 RepID=A0AAV6W259_9ARAC|nr:hypothetical protein JTE90_010382 [Oedothorax gibbosus]